MDQVLQILVMFLWIYTLCVFAWALISWLPMISPPLAYNDTVVSVRRFLDSLVLPYVRQFRFVPPLRMGGQMLDLSALVAIIVLQVALKLLVVVING